MRFARATVAGIFPVRRRNASATSGSRSLPKYMSSSLT
jgi:hypothetical protein